MVRGVADLSDCEQVLKRCHLVNSILNLNRCHGSSEGRIDGLTRFGFGSKDLKGSSPCCENEKVQFMKSSQICGLSIVLSPK